MNGASQASATFQNRPKIWRKHSLEDEPNGKFSLDGSQARERVHAWRTRPRARLPMRRPSDMMVQSVNPACENPTQSITNFTRSELCTILMVIRAWVGRSRVETALGLPSRLKLENHFVVRLVALQSTETSILNPLESQDVRRQTKHSGYR